MCSGCGFMVSRLNMVLSISVTVRLNAWWKLLAVVELFEVKSRHRSRSNSARLRQAQHLLGDEAEDELRADRRDARDQDSRR